MRSFDWNSVEASKEFEMLPMGGYVMKIIKAYDNPAKEYIKLELDIAEGKYTNYYMSGGWYLTAYVSYKSKALGMFKAFFLKVEESNPGFKFDNDETKFEGKKIGAVLRHEEYENNQGDVKVGVKVANWKTVDDIKKGKFKMPELKVLEKSAPTGFTAPTDSEIPF